MIHVGIRGQWGLTEAKLLWIRKGWDIKKTNEKNLEKLPIIGGIFETKLEKNNKKNQWPKHSDVGWGEQNRLGEGRYKLYNAVPQYLQFKLHIIFLFIFSNESGNRRGNEVHSGPKVTTEKTWKAGQNLYYSRRMWICLLQWAKAEMFSPHQNFSGLTIKKRKIKNRK